MRIGFICNKFDVQLADALPLYKEMGVDEIDLFAPELDSQVEAFVVAVREAGVPVTSLSPRWGWIACALQDPSEVDRLRAFIEAGPRLGSERVMLSCSFAKPQSDKEIEAHNERVIDIYRTVAQDAERKGIDLCTHTTTRPGIMFGTVAGRAA